MNTRLAILQLLADGQLHSGADIGRHVGVTRAAVHKSIKTLSATGLGVHSAAGIGYRLDAPLVPLDPARIQDALQTAGATACVEVVEQVGSTNRYLLERALTSADPKGLVCLTEAQPQGRGRQGKTWVATPYENLMMSMAWRFDVGPAMVMGLSLAAGVAAIHALTDYGVTGVGLKWPNDILWTDHMASTPSRVKTRSQAVSSLAPYPLPRGEGELVRSRDWSVERKLAGLLVDVHGEASGPCTVVLGIGVNCRLRVADGERIDQPWIDLSTIMETIIDRNRLAALLIARFDAMFRRYSASGLAAYAAEWNRLNLYANRGVRLVRNHASIEGIVEGIDDNGALRLRDADGRVHVFHSGEVSLRAAAECVS